MARPRPTSRWWAGPRPRWSATPNSARPSCCSDAITDALEPLGLTRADIDFTCLGSCDYITGQAFSFVGNLDAIGAWPPKRDSHVEMDGAWALYEAWLRLQEGDIEIAVVTGSGRSSTGDPALIYPMEMDPYYLAPIGADPVTFAALQARAVIAAGIADERSMAEVAVRSRGKGDVDDCWPSDYVREPLRRHDLPPITDGAAAMVLATGDRARQLVERPAYITGFDHRTECHNPSFRALDDSPSTRHRRRGGRTRRRAGGGRRVAGRLHPRGAAAAPVLGLGDDVTVNPLVARSGQPDHGHRPLSHRLCRRPHFRWWHRALAHATSGPCLQQNLICILEGRS